MRLIFVIKSLNTKGGGAERVLVDIANALVERGHDIRIMTFDHARGQPFYSIDVRIVVDEIGTLEAGHFISRTKLLCSLPRLRRKILSARPDIVVAFMHSAYVPVAVALLGAGVKLVLSEHTSAAHYKGRPLQRMAARHALTFAVAKTVPTNAVRSEHPVAQQSKVHVLPNPVNLMDSQRGPLQVEAQENIVLSIGGFRPEKDHRTLIDAFARLAPEFPNWTLRLVGDGALRSAIETQIDRRGLEKNVSLAGWQRDVVAEYKAASFVAVPSQYEAFGLVTAEALACGRPVVSFASCVGSRELIDHSVNGLLASEKPDRVTALADAMKTLMSDQPLRDRLGNNAAASVSRFDPGHVVTAWETFLSGHARPPTSN